MNANYKPGEKLRRGQLYTTYVEIAEESSWAVGFRIERYKRSQIESAIKALKKATAIITKKTTRGFIVTIVDYERWVLMKQRVNRTESTL